MAKKNTNKKIVAMKKTFLEEELEYVFDAPNLIDHNQSKHALIPIFAMTLATYPMFYEKIDDLYEQNPFEHHLAFKKSEFKHFYRLESLNLQQEFYAKRLVALFEYDFLKKNGKNTFELFQLLKTRYYHQAKEIQKVGIYTQDFLAYKLYPLEGELKQTPRKFNVLSAVEDIRALFAKKHSMYAFLLDNRLRYDFLMLFLAKGFQKEIDYDKSEVLQKAALSTMNEQEITEAYVKAMLSNKLDEEGDQFLSEVWETLNKTFYDDDTLYTEFDEIFQYKQVRVLRNANISHYDIYSLLRYIELRENYTLPNVLLPANKKEAERLVKEILATSPYSEDEKLEKYYYVYLGLFFKQIIEENKTMRSFFYETETDEQLLEVKRLKEELEAEKQKSNTLEKKLTEKEKEINEIKKKHQAEWNHVTQENRKYRDIVNNLDDALNSQHEELHYLRELSYELEQEFNEAVSKKPTDALSFFLEEIASKKIVIVGGHPNWKNKVKERIPSVIFVDKDTHFDSSFLATADFVYYQIDHLSHGVFYRTHPIVKKENVPFGFIPSGNVNITLLQMEHEWEKNKKRKQNA